MTRPPGASFAQFFPTAPKVKVQAQSRPERDRDCDRDHHKAASPNSASDLVPVAVSNPDVDGFAKPGPGPGGPPSDAITHDDTDSPITDIPGTVDSASSYSSAASSIFSSSHRNAATSASSRLPTSSLTPLASKDSPSNNSVAVTIKPDMATSLSADSAAAYLSDNSSAIGRNGAISNGLPALGRVPARDPMPSVKGLKCTYDPLLDRVHNKSVSRSSKPTYQEFGMDDDAPPTDPRLLKPGGRLGYINTDYYLPKARLRQAPENIRPYPYDPKTSIGPGPPTQIVVTRYNPLVPFNKVTAIFATFGEIAESSNKMHPETGSYLGFATIRYRDSKRADRPSVSAIDAARRAVRTRGIKVDADIVKVEYDPEGRKSRRMLEEHLRREKEKQEKTRLAQATSQSKTPPTGPKSNSASSFVRPPPTAPRGPAVSRTPAPTPPTQPLPTPVQARGQPGVETQSVAEQLNDEPYIHVPSESVPVLPSIIPHMKKRLKNYGFEDIRLDKAGFYVVFRNSFTGKSEAERCFRAVNHTEFFNYDLSMQLCLPRDKHDAESSRRPRRASPSPERRSRVEVRQREDRERRRREDEADLEEEKKQRAKNFDPVLEAVEVVRREMTEHLIRHIRTKVAAPALNDFLEPSNHVAKRRKLNIEHPDDVDTIPSIEDGNDSSRVGTPNSRADPIERRTGRLEPRALPRIRKTKVKGQAQRSAFIDPFARHRPAAARNQFRSLHHRLRGLDSDVESDDDADTRVLAHETEEPESRPRSRMSTDEDISPWGPGEDDSMTEASFAIADGPILSKKRKLEVSIETAFKRQKKSDEELFGVKIGSLGSGFAPREDSVDVFPDGEDETRASRSETPVSVSARGTKKKPTKAKKKTKKQLFEEREALKRQVETDSQRDEDEEVEKELVKDEPKVEEKQLPDEEETLPKKHNEKLLSTVALTPALVLPDGQRADLSMFQGLALGPGDGPDLIKLAKRFQASNIGDPELWLWKRKRVRELNSVSGGTEATVGIRGYYVPNPTGCARTEGVHKILNSEKSKYLPHHLKIQKVREEREREARNKKSGKDQAAAAQEAAKIAAEKLIAKGNSRANRAQQRRLAADINDQKKTLGQDSDVLKFNQLKKRKKPVKFARSAIHNWGLYTMENIAKDDMIIEYVGEEVRQQIAEIREKRYLKSGIGSSYLFRIDDNTVIDATKKGGIARFINHSCMPNCTAKIIKVEGSKRIVIYALRDIPMNEELTYDYKFEREMDSLDRIPCLCGTAACKGFLN
ncbi:histone H3 methyltransferase complex protein [Mariannaea sp. PMI_226]|nr:histone H3 methyltransferase complex protein [Mariannaea sp. PMI_226]